MHGAPYHAQSQGLAEKNVDHIKKMICKLGYLRDKEFQEMVWSLNFMASSRPGMGSPAMRLHGRDVQGPLPSPPSSLTEEQVQALRRRHQELKDKAVQRQNARPEEFQVGDQVLVWSPRQKRFTEPGVIDSPMWGDNLVARSYKIIMESGRVRHVAAALIVRAATQQ